MDDPPLGDDLLKGNGQYSFSLAVWFLKDLPHLYFIELTSDSDLDLCLKVTFSGNFEYDLTFFCICLFFQQKASCRYFGPWIIGD